MLTSVTYKGSVPSMWWGLPKPPPEGWSYARKRPGILILTGLGKVPVGKKASMATAKGVQCFGEGVTLKVVEVGEKKGTYPAIVEVGFKM